MTTTDWFLGDAIYNPNSSEPLDDPPPYTFTDLSPLTQDPSLLQRVSYLFCFEWQNDVSLCDLESH